MFVRSQANSLVTAVQTALRSGEWIIDNDSPVVPAMVALESALLGMASNEVIDCLMGDLAELTGEALLSGEWMPGDWASEWQGQYVELIDSGVTMPFFIPGQAMSTPRLAA